MNLPLPRFFFSVKAQNITLLKIVHYRYTPQTAYAGSAIYSEQNVHAEHKVDAVFTVSSVCIVDWAVRKKSSREFSGFFSAGRVQTYLRRKQFFPPLTKKLRNFRLRTVISGVTSRSVSCLGVSSPPARPFHGLEERRECLHTKNEVQKPKSF